jgi:HIV-1 Vpr-binding protein
VFTTAGDVIYGLQLEQEVDDETKFETSFKTFEASDYSSIATTETKKSVLGLCPSWDDLSLAVVEQVFKMISSIDVPELASQ